MPVEIGTASGHLDLLHRLQRFVCGHGTWSAAPQFTGDGPGTISGIATAPATITETWTITCSNADIPGEEIWTVTGSVTGATADATELVGPREWRRDDTATRHRPPPRLPRLLVPRAR